MLRRYERRESRRKKRNLVGEALEVRGGAGRVCVYTVGCEDGAWAGRCTVWSCRHTITQR